MAMAVVNCCAVGIYPSQKVLDWAQGLDLDIDAAGAREPCLYLIPYYETQEEAGEILEEVCEAIFGAELDYWDRDTGAWPAEHHAGPNCIPQLTCQPHQGLIAQGDHLVSRCPGWTEDLLRQRWWAPEVG
jgi:hypothetical protein